MSFSVANVALEDADSAATWYDSRRPKLGKKFLDELERIFQRIQDHLIRLRMGEKGRERSIFPTPVRPRE